MKQYRSLISGIALVAVTLAFSGCPKNTEVASSPESQKDQATATAPTSTVKNEAGTNGDQTAANQAGNQEPAERSGVSAKGLQKVYFEYNESTLTDSAKSALKGDAEWLKANPKARIRIEGNCDERGTSEYNQALGQRRAAAAKKYLAGLGIKGSRISLISYGKEKPVCTESNDSCWQKNRRDDFTVQAD